MRFRYKAMQYCTMPLKTFVTHYKITIQIYNTNKSKWEKFKQEDLSNIIQKTFNIPNDFFCGKLSNNYLKDCLYYINKCNGLDNIMMKYIKKILKEDELLNQKFDEEHKTIMELDKMLLSKDWKVIEIDEVKTDD